MSVAEKTIIRSARKAKGHGHLRRAEILEAAERIFIAYGYEGATIRKIADEVGVSSTALYVHVRDKGEILAEICANTFNELYEITAAIAAENLAPLEKLRRMLESYVDFGLANPSAYRLVYGATPMSLSEEQRKAMDAVQWRPYGPFNEAITAAVEGGHLKADARLASEIFWMGSHGLIELLLTRPANPWVESAKLKATMIDTLFYGLVRT